jgi:hypothetical protein
MSSKSKMLQRLGLTKYSPKERQKLLREGIIDPEVLDGTSLSTKVKTDDFIDADYDTAKSARGFGKDSDAFSGFGNKGKAALGLGVGAGLGSLYLGGEDEEEEPSTADVPLPSVEEPTVEPPKEDDKGGDNGDDDKDKYGLDVPEPTATKPIKIEYDLEKELKETERPVDQSEEYGLVDEEYKKSLAQAYDTYQKTKDQQASAALWESIINGVGHLAAGVIGGKEGLDLSGVKFDKTDWDAKATQNLAELRSAVSQARDVRIMSGDVLDRNYKRSLDQLQQNEKIRDRAFDVAITNAKLAKEAEETTAKRQQDFFDNKYKNATLILAQKEAAEKSGDEETLALIKERGDVEKRLATLTKQAIENPEMVPTYKAELERYEQLSQKLGIENPAYSTVDLAVDEGWISTTPSIQKGEIKRRARVQLQNFPGKKGKVYKQTYDWLLENPDAKDAAKYKVQLEREFPGLFSGEVEYE